MPDLLRRNKEKRASENVASAAFSEAAATKGENMKQYWKGKLHSEAAACYDLIVNGVKARQERIDCRETTPNDVQKAYFAVYQDHPELFYMGHACQVSQRGVQVAFVPLRLSSCLQIQNVYDNKTIDRCRAEINKILSGFSRDRSDKDLVLQCMDYLVMHTDYEINNETNQNAAAALCFHKAQCSGISRALQLMLQHLQIPCIIVEGEAVDEKGQRGPHAWNIVGIDGKYYHVDATFMLGANMMKIQPLRRLYAFYDDKKMAETHTWNRVEVPACTDASIYPTLTGLRGILGNSGLGNLFGEKGLFGGGSIFGSGSKKTPPAKCFNSLYELKMAMREMITNRETILSFQMNIQVNDVQELQRLVKNACDSVMKTSGVGMSCRIQIANNQEITLTVTYS